LSDCSNPPVGDDDADGARADLHLVNLLLAALAAACVIAAIAGSITH
jgi:hypothetical protein